MKKLLVLLVLFLVFTFRLFSQQVSLNLKAGINISELKGSNEYSSGLTKGFHVGPGLSIKASKRFTIEPSILLAQKGTYWDKTFFAEDAGKSVYYNTHQRYRLTYLDMPVMLKMEVLSGFNIFAGPQFSYLLQSVYIYENSFSFNGERASPQNGKEKSLTGYKRFDFALTGGIGYNFNNRININAGYDLGLYSIQEEGESIVNRVIKVSLGYTF